MMMYEWDIFWEETHRETVSDRQNAGKVGSVKGVRAGALQV